MALVNAYSTVERLRERLTLQTTARQEMLEAVLNATSRAVDHETQRRYYTVTESRVYRPIYGTVEIDAAVSVSSVAVDTAGDGSYATTLAAAAWRLWPDNAALDGKPYTRVVPTGQAAWPGWPLWGYDITINAPVPQDDTTRVHPVRVTGAFGYAATAPPSVEEATLRIAQRLFANGLGVPVPMDGAAKQIIADDPDIQRLLGVTARKWVLA